MEEFCSENKEVLESLSFSRYTVARRIESLSDDIKRTVELVASNFVSFSIGQDESTDNSDTFQLVITVRWVHVTM